MRPSQAFQKRAKKLIAPLLKEPDRAAAVVRDLLGDFLPDMSRSLREEFFQLYWERYLSSEGKTLYDLIEWHGPVIDLFHGLQDDLEGDFSEEEWDLIRDAIREGSETMDMRLLHGLLAYLVEKKRY